MRPVRFSTVGPGRRCHLSKAQCFPAEEWGACPMGRGLAGPYALPFGLLSQSQLQSQPPGPRRECGFAWLCSECTYHLGYFFLND